MVRGTHPTLASDSNNNEIRKIEKSTNMKTLSIRQIQTELASVGSMPLS